MTPALEADVYAFLERVSASRETMRLSSDELLQWRREAWNLRERMRQEALRAHPTSPVSAPGVVPMGESASGGVEQPTP